MPVHTAYALPTGRHRSAHDSRPKLMAAELMNARDHPSRLNPSDSFSETPKVVSNSPATLTIAHATAALLPSLEPTVQENWNSRTNGPGCVALQRGAGDGAGHAPGSAAAAAQLRARDPHHLDAGRLERGVGDGVAFVGHRQARGDGEGVVAVVPLLALGGDRVETGVDHPQPVDAHGGGRGLEEGCRAADDEVG